MSDSPATGKRWIRPLPERLINKIAAGEVIERPAAVLKELVENSFDAGASRIDLIIEKSGTKLITVIDDGCGIDTNQVEIAFSRHATSKISDFRDLENLRSFGFRGEALPSIGSVSKTRMITRTADSDTGTEIVIEGGVVQNIRQVAAPFGTKVEVIDLFFNTPARRKFLKAETTEASHLTRNAMALALSKPQVRFGYTLNGRKVFSLDDNHIDLMSRVGHLLLGQNQGHLLEVTTQSDIMSVRGYLSFPDILRQNQNGLFIFINERYIKSQTMIHAVTAGYGELLPKGNYPVGAIFLNVDPAKVDVNVHPTKSEVRLSEERQVHDILFQAVKRAVRESGSLNSPHISMETINPSETRTVPEAIRRIRGYEVSRASTADTQSMMKELYGYRELMPKDETSAGFPLPGMSAREISAISADYKKTDIDIDRVTFLGSISELYLIFKIDDQLLIIDQHTAHERVLYEENLKLIETGGATSQHLLFPVNVELSPDRLTIFEESSEILRAVGFVAELFGTRTVLLSAVPVALARKSPERIFLEMLEDIENLHRAGQGLKKAVVQSMACRAAVMAGDRLTPQEALALLNRLLSAEDKYSCPHGRPTILKLSKDELDVKFGRK